MQNEDKVILAGAALIAGYFLYQKFVNPAKVTAQEAKDLTIRAAVSRDTDTWFAPMQNAQAILEKRPDVWTTYFIDENTYNKMSNWERLLFAGKTSLSRIFG